MYNLDENYLRELGVADMPEEVKKPLVEGLEKQIQDRVSLKMAQGLSDERLDEFAGINDGDGEAVLGYLRSVAPQFESDVAYAQARAVEGVNVEELNREYAQTKWLEQNVPNYAEIVLETLNEVKEEILAQRRQVSEN